MSWKDGYVRAAPKSLTRADRSSEPPVALRESFIRTKPSPIDGALDEYALGDSKALEGFEPDLVAAALRVRVAVEGPAACAALGELMVSVIESLLAERLGVEIACQCAAAYPHQDYVDGLLALCLDANVSERLAAEEALGAHVGMLRAGLTRLRASVASRDTVQDRRRRGIRLLGSLGDELSLSLFISLLGDADRSIARAAHAALRELTCHDLGLMRVAWQRWAEKNGAKERVDWLIEALVDRRVPLRTSALHCLEECTGESFGIEEGQSLEAFAAGQERFAEWRGQQLAGPAA